MTFTLSALGTPGRATTVLTSWGRETYQIWIQPAPPGWVARIVTLPDRLWSSPGGRHVLKFYGESAVEAEAAAMRFIEDECVRTSRRIAPPLVGETDSVPPPALLDPDRRATNRVSIPPGPPGPPTLHIEPALRTPRRLLLRFGPHQPDRPALTGNLSETGLFIITDRPIPAGVAVQIDLRFPEGPVRLDARSIWVRGQQIENLSVGFGVHLRMSPRDYIQRVRTLRDAAIWP